MFLNSEAYNVSGVACFAVHVKIMSQDRHTISGDRSRPPEMAPYSAGYAAEDKQSSAGDPSVL